MKIKLIMLAMCCMSVLAQESKPASCCQSHKAEVAVCPELPGTSIFHLKTTWKDQDNQDFTLSQLAGNPTLVAMIFTHCPDACPRIMADLGIIDKALEANDNVRYLLVSMDPKRDTPAVLKDFAKRWNLDMRRWTLITSDQAKVLEIAAVLGVKYQSTADGDFNHSNQIALIDDTGVIIHKQLGLSSDPAETISFLRKWLNPNQL